MKQIFRFFVPAARKAALWKNGFIVLAGLMACLVSCKPDEPSPEALVTTEQQLPDLIADGQLYTLRDFVNTFMSEEGNYLPDASLYRTRSHNESINPGIYLFSIDTIPADGPGIYIRGRVATDDWGGNFYKSMVLQQIVDGKQQALRISVDAGSLSGLYPRGQEILIRCNGLAIGRYANQVQLCVPTYNNNIYAQHADEKMGWAPGRIPFSMFKKAVHLLGEPDASKLVYDVLTIGDINAIYSVLKGREEDGKLVRIEGIHYTGQCLASNKEPMNCTCGNPADDTNANVFAPTTSNVGYPQSRLVADAEGKYLCVSMSEYAKQARFYLPGAGSAYDGVVFVYDSVQSEIPATPYLTASVNGKSYCIRVSEEKMQQGWQMDDVFFIDTRNTRGFVYDGTFWTDKLGILHCPDYVGSVQGVLSYYMDNAKYAPAATNWSVSICDLGDLKLQKEDGTPWSPREYVVSSLQ